MKKSKRPVSITISSHVKDTGLGEIYQSVDLKMAILTRQGPGEFTRITPFVKCRDFLVDAYSYSRVGKKFAVYGMKLDPALDMPQKDGVYLELLFPSNEVQQNFENNLHFLANIEVVNDFEHTEYIPQEEKPLYAVLIADKGWLTNCLSFSLYTALLRCFAHKLEPDGWIPQMRAYAKVKDAKGKFDTDGLLVDSITDETWMRVLSDVKELGKAPGFCGFDPAQESLNVYTLHHNSGFFSVFGTHRELNTALVKENAHWKYFKEAGWELHTK